MNLRTERQSAYHYFNIPFHCPLPEHVILKILESFGSTSKIAFHLCGSIQYVNQIFSMYSSIDQDFRVVNVSSQNRVTDSLIFQ